MKYLINALSFICNSPFELPIRHSNRASLSLQEEKFSSPGSGWKIILSPAVVIPILVILAFILVSMLAALFQVSFFPVGKFRLGFDFVDFYRAINFGRTGDPYGMRPVPTQPRFVTPPGSLLAFQIFSYLSEYSACVLQFFLNFACILAAQILVCLQLFEKNKFLLFVTIGSCVASTLFSFPVAMLMNRGNVDGEVLLLTCLSIFSLQQRSTIPSGYFGCSCLQYKNLPAPVTCSDGCIPQVERRRRFSFLCLCAVSLVSIIME